MIAEMNFNWPIIGHDKLKKNLQTGIRNQSMAHAYLFYGPKKVGKTLTAKFFAKSILCENYRKRFYGKAGDDTTPCGQCSACRQVENRIYPDLYFLERESAKKSGVKQQISVSQVRDLLTRINKRSFLNSYKVVIIPEAEYLSVQAANSLLKTLEEPFAKTVIILIAGEKRNILPTILSRSRILKFLPVARTAIYDYLVEKGANRELAKELSFMAHGRPTVAMKLFTDKELLREYRQMNKEILGLLKNDVIEKFKQIEQHTKKGQDKEKIQQKLTYLTGLLRDVLLVKNYKRELLANPYLEEELSVFAEQKSTGELCRLIYGAEQAKEYIKANINSRLVLENLLLNN